MADIFISYKQEERALAAALAEDLEVSGYSVWWDTRLVGGPSFRTQILRQLNMSHAVIVIWTPASVLSEWVLDEADHAAADRKLIPVRVHDLEIRAIPLGHRQRQTYLLTERDRILDALIALGVISRLAIAGLEPQRKPEPCPWPVESVNNDPRWSWVWLTGSLATILVSNLIFLALGGNLFGYDSEDWGSFFGGFVVLISAAWLAWKRRREGAERAVYWFCGSIGTIFAITAFFDGVRLSWFGISADETGALIGSTMVALSAIWLVQTRWPTLSVIELAIYWLGGTLACVLASSMTQNKTTTLATLAITIFIGVGLLLGRKKDPDNLN